MARLGQGVKKGIRKRTWVTTISWEVKSAITEGGKRVCGKGEGTVSLGNLLVQNRETRRDKRKTVETTRTIRGTQASRKVRVQK